MEPTENLPPSATPPPHPQQSPESPPLQPAQSMESPPHSSSSTASPPPSPASGAAANDNNLGMLCHLLALTGLLIPGGNVVGPLVLWLLKKDSSAVVDAHGKESLNFQITVTGAMLICFATFWLFLPILLAIVIGLGALVLTIIGSIKASNGVLYRYPFTLRLVK